MSTNSLKRVYLILFVCLQGLSFVEAQESVDADLSVQSLEEAWEYAHKHNPNLQQYRLQQEKATIDYKVAKSAKRPQISGSFSLQNNTSLAVTPLPGEIFGQPGETVDAQFGQEYTYNAGITITKNLINKQQHLQTKMSGQNVLLMSQQTEVYEQSLKEQVALYYYTALVAEKGLQISQRDLTIANSIVKISQEKLDEGTIDQLALNQALINENNVKQNLVQYESLLAQCQQELSKLWGVSSGLKLSLTETISSQLPEVQLYNELAPDAALKLSETELAQAEMGVKVERAAYLPTISVNSYYGKQQFRDNFGLSTESGSWTDYSYITFSLNVPIFTGFGTKNRVKSAQIEYDMAYKELENVRRTAEVDDAFLIEEYRRSWAQLTAIHKNYQLFKENADLTHQKHEEGLVSLEASLKSFEDYLQAENNYLNSLSNYYSYYAGIISRNP